MDKETVPKEEIEKLKTQTEGQLNYARKQTVVWTKKVNQLIGSLAICNVILEGKIKKEKEDK